MDQQQQFSLGLLGILDFRLILRLSKYLMACDILSLGLTNSFFKEQLLNFKKRVVHLEKMATVKNNGIQLYLEVDISDIYDKIEVIMAVVETKDQGWANIQNSFSWVTLTLFNEPQDYQSYGIKSYEKIIYSNYCESKFAQKKLTITQTMAMDQTKKKQYETILGLSRKGKFKKIGIVQKCLYQDWECYLKSGQIIILYRD
ncbi:unnamed protein product [Paramecium primaurelia]|uniref:Uncharacterized protein n=1 Tax=Paramecium primaurelia TaxID=5886 RepID=A0A8S1MJI6_PARPR|nr:unnamed protein product [Paramecium primaurelia]